MRLGRRQTSTTRWASALLALLSLAPVGALQSEPAPCFEPGAAALADAAATRTARAGGGTSCMPCCREKTAPVEPARPTVSCGCCVRGPVPEPTRSPTPAPVFDLIATAAGSEGVLMAALPAMPALDRFAPAHESAPPARLLHCVHRI